MGVIDWSKFNFSAEEIRNIGKDVLQDSILEAPDVKGIMTIYDGEVYNKQVGYFGEGEMVGKAGAGCDLTAQNWQISTRTFTWVPKDWYVYLTQCYSEFLNTAAVYSLQYGINIADFTNTEIGNILSAYLLKSLRKFIIRLAWFNDTSAATVANSGTLKTGTDISYFNILDGLFKQIELQCTANAKQKVTIKENANSTYATQKISVDNIQGYLEDLYFNAPIALRNMSDNFILCTQSFFDAYKKSLQVIHVETNLSYLENGKETLSYNGVKLIPMPIWDEMLQNYDTGTKLINPHRALFTNKAILGLAVDSFDSFENIDMWFDKDSQKVKELVRGKADVKLTNPNLFMYAV